MSFERKRRRGKQPPPCDQLGPDDGIDPRIYFRNEPRRRGDDRKVRQLCAQAARALQFAFAGLCRDPILQQLDVVSVEPAPDARRLRVIVRPCGEGASVSEVQERLAEAYPLLRSAVAAEVRRRRAPELLLQVRPFGSEAPS